MRIRRRLAGALVAILWPALAAAQGGQAAAQPLQDLGRGGYSIFHETMVDMSFDEVEAAAARHAIVLWPMGVVEQHGPHLPLGTDIYNSYLRMKQTQRLLKAQGIETIMAPPLYWGINEATGSFGGSFILRPSTLKAIIEDTFWSFRKDGFQTVYITTGHGDRLHNQTIVEAVRDARAVTGMRGFVIVNTMMQQRLGVSEEDPHVLIVPGGPGAPAGLARSGPVAQAPPGELEVHAGGGETSTVWAFFPGLVKAELIPKLEGTRYGPADLAEWRKGWDNARHKTPLGYFGDPTTASRERGFRALEAETARTAKAIADHVRNSPWNRQTQQR